MGQVVARVIAVNKDNGNEITSAQAYGNPGDKIVNPLDFPELLNNDYVYVNSNVPDTFSDKDNQAYYVYFSKRVTDVSNSEGDGDDEFAGNPRIVKDESLIKEITLDKLGFSIQNVKMELLSLGNDLVDTTTGKPYTDDVYTSCILRAVSLIEKKLDIVIRPRIVYDKLDYDIASFSNYDTLRLYNKPAIQIDKVQIRYGNNVFWKIPQDWIKLTQRFGVLQIFPTSFLSMGGFGLAQSMPIIQNLLGSNTVFKANNNHYAPQLQNVKYLAGMLPRQKGEEGIDKDYYVPEALIAWVSKQAAVEILERYGRTLSIGVGISGYTTHIDGISTSVDTTNSATESGTGADIQLLQRDMKEYMSALKGFYGISGPTFLGG